MYYQNGYMQPQQPQYMPQQLGLKGRPVTSLDEVRAAQIDFDGSLYVFPDIGHNRIYTKAINLDGTATLNMYELTQIPTQTQGNFVTREEFEAAVAQLKESMTQVKDPAPAPARAF